MINIINQTAMRKINHAKLKFLIISVLEEQKDKTLTQGKIADLVAKKLNEQELTEHYARESYKKFYKMIATNEQRLQAAGLEVFLKNGHKITNNGHKAWEDNKKSEEITYEYLRTIPEYNEWEKRLGLTPKKESKELKEKIENDLNFVVPLFSKPGNSDKDCSKTKFNENELLNTVYNIRRSFHKKEWYYRVSEENVRAEIVDPILKVIGWEFPFLRREERYMDYLLCNDAITQNTPKLIIETKKYREQLQTSGNDKNSEIEPVNEWQLRDYCISELASAGILTNGIRWCLYTTGDSFEYQGEINICKSTNQDIIHFFNAISKNELDKISQTDWNWLSKSLNVEFFPTTIKIDNESFSQHYKASYKIGKLFIEECKKREINPLSCNFFRKIVSSSKTRTCQKEGAYYIIGDYLIYDKIALFQEINSTLDLGLTITVE